MAANGNDSLAYSEVTIDPALQDGALPAIEVLVHQAEYMHDIAEITLRGERDNTLRYRTGAPVHIVFGRRPAQSEDFFGYIDHAEPVLDRKNVEPHERTMKVWCVGASYTMKQRLNGVYVGRTAQSVLRGLAEQFLFTTDVPDSNTDILWPSLSSSGLTAWKFCVETARKSGLVFYCNKTEIRAYDAMTLLVRDDRAFPTFYHRDTFPQIDTVLSFKPESGDYHPERGRRRIARTAYGVNPITGEVVVAQDDGISFSPIQLAQKTPTVLFNEYEPDMVVGSVNLATQRLKAEAKFNRFHVRAKAEVSGDVRLHQGTFVILEGLGTKHSGVWYVHEAHHRISTQRYATELVLGRDSEYDNGFRPSLPSNVVRPRYDPFNTQVKAKPPTLLAGGIWRSAWLAKPAVTGVG